jgi:hypothetical protein
MSTTHRTDLLRLVLASGLALFIELALIRLIPGQVRVVGYYTNLVLIASFLGLGLGFLVSDARVRLERFLLPGLFALMGLVRLFSGIVVENPDQTDEPMWLFGQEGGLGLAVPIWLVVLVHFVAVAACLVPVGQLMGRLFDRLPRLRAYGADLLGSLLGVVGFGVLSAMGTPPLLWFGIAGVAIVSVVEGLPWKALGVGSLLGLSVVLNTMTGGDRIWSPYYMVELDHVGPGMEQLSTNGTPHQVMLDFEEPSDYIQRTRQRFEIPYRRAQSLDRVLIVGAGTGNDVAMALSMGAGHVDAVEIDRTFPRIGAERHPQKPYADPRVTLHVTDARAFFQRAEGPYDLIVFGTLDSQALLSGFSSIRLDNYIYTQESFDAATGLLAPEGMLAVFHLSQRFYIADRIEKMLEVSGGKPPAREFFEEHTLFNFLFMQGPTVPVRERTEGEQARIENEPVPTDDWPFLYLRHRTVPQHYLHVLVGMLIVSIGSIGAAVRGRTRHFDLPLFLLGAGFLLLETSSVTRMSLLFGSTWAVNLLVFSSILTVLAAATAWVRAREEQNRPLPVRPLFAVLTGLLLVSTMVPVHWIVGLPTVVTAVLGGLLVAGPIGVAGLLFPTLYARASDSRMAFGSNLLGAILGGTLEYTGMALGVRSLGLMAAVLYLLAMMLVERRPAAD